MSSNLQEEKVIGEESSEAKIIDGKKTADDIRTKLQNQIKEWMTKDNHRAPKLITVLIGDDTASQIYVNSVQKAAHEVGIESEAKIYPKTITEDELIMIIDELNRDESVDSIIVMLPLPNHIDEQNICNLISCDKDVDGCNKMDDKVNVFVPCTALGIKELLTRYDIETTDKHAVVVGCNKHVGKSIMKFLHADGIDRDTPRDDLKSFCKNADIVVVSTGIPGLIQADMIKPGAAVIDVGITRIFDEKTGKSKLVGDVDFENVKKVAGFITPVPGGVGPMTVAMLMKNTFDAAKRLAESRAVKHDD